MEPFDYPQVCGSIRAKSRRNGGVFTQTAVFTAAAKTNALPLRFYPLRNNIALCTLGADERPLTGHDEVTSVDRSLVLSSTAVHLGEHGSIHDLAESEIYRWANVHGYVALHRTQPIYLSENRCMMHLRLTGVRLGMEQVVVYTRLSGGMARVDRLWHPLSERENDPSAAVFAATAAALTAL